MNDKIEPYRISGGVRSRAFLFGILLIGLSIVALLQVPIVEVRYSERLPEETGVRQLVHMLIQTAEENEYYLPNGFEELDSNHLEGILVDRYIYVAPGGARIVDIPHNTALVVLPWNDGAHVGYLGGNVIFRNGGFDADKYERVVRRIRHWQVGFLVCVILLIIITFGCFSLRRKWLIVRS